MLKRLVKYGNSNALILDRSILALLDISEGAVVKLRIEGDSLIVKAEKNMKASEALAAEFLSIAEATNSLTSSSEENDTNATESIKESVPGSEDQLKLQYAYGKILQKYQDKMKPLSSKEFQKELQDLKSKYEKIENSSEFIKEVLALREKFAPGLAEMDKEMQIVTKALGFPV